jgi:hypothetical protein
LLRNAGTNKQRFAIDARFSSVIGAADSIDTLTARGPHVDCSTEKRERRDDYRQCAGRLQVAE